MEINKKIMILGLVIVAIILVGTAVGIRVELIDNLNMNNNLSIDNNSGLDNLVDDDLIVNDIVLDRHYYENVSNYPNDSNIINSVELNGDILTIEVQYGGGCEEHIFSLFGSPGFEKSKPVQTDVMLSHNANNDMCKSLITEEVAFDLTPLKEVWQQMYGESGTIIINLEGFDDPIFYEF